MAEHPAGTVTFLFTDIQGSTRLFDALGSRFHDLQAHHHRLIRDAVEEHDGVVVDTMGDGVFAAFGMATDAVIASVAAQRALASHAWPDDGAIKVRMGLHSGEATPTRDGDYVSLAVHHAARVADAGHGGQIIVSPATHALVDGKLPDVSFDDLGPHRLKDLSGPINLFQVGHEALPERFPPLRSLDRVAHNLPVQLTSFVGRDTELREVTKLVADNRLVTVTGAGGAGKTRLALQVAGEIAVDRAGGAWLTELAGVVDPDDVLMAVADALLVRSQSGRTPRDLVIDRLAVATLLVLDNCEHVLTASADLATDLLRSCPDLAIVATSREPLGVPGEVVWRIPSLDTDDGDDLDSDAARLFIERARHRRPGWTPDSREDRDAVGEICRRLDGMPLAIELAAARIDVLGVAQIRDRLHDRFRLLTGGSRATLERQRTLRATVEWSHELLDEPAQQLLRRLSVFVGGFTLDAAEQVAVDDDVDALDVLDLLGDLVHKSLVLADDAGPTLRYRMLETIRQYAREQLMGAGEAEVVQRAHYDWALALVREDQGRLDFIGFDELAWDAAVEAEHENLIAALTWAADHPDLDRLDALLVSVAPSWLRRGHVNLSRDWLNDALDRSGDRPPVTTGELHCLLGWAHWRLGDNPEARRHLDLARSVLPDDAPAGVRIRLWNYEGNLRHSEENHAGAIEAYDEGLRLARETGNRVLESQLLGNRTLAMAGLGQGDEAVELLEAAREIALQANARRNAIYHASNLLGARYVRLGGAEVDAALAEFVPELRILDDPILLSGALNMQFQRALVRDLDRAGSVLGELIALARRRGMVTTEAGALNSQGRLEFVRGDVESSVATGREMVDRWQQLLRGARPDEPSIIEAIIDALAGDHDAAIATIAAFYERDEDGSSASNAVFVAVWCRDPGWIRRWAERGEQWRRRLGAVRDDSSFLIALGLADLDDGDLDDATGHFTTAARLEISDGDTQYLLDALSGLGAVAVRRADLDRAGRVLGAVHRARLDTGMIYSDTPSNAWFDEAKAAAEAADATRFAAAWDDGMTIGPDRLFAFAAEIADG